MISIKREYEEDANIQNFINLLRIWEDKRIEIDKKRE